MEEVEMVNIYLLNTDVSSMPSISKPLAPKKNFHPWDTRVYETPNVLLISFVEYGQYSFEISDMPTGKVEIVKTPTTIFRQVKFTTFDGKLMVRYGHSSDRSVTETDSGHANFQMLYPGRLAPMLPLHTLDIIHAFLDKHFPDVIGDYTLTRSETDELEEIRFAESYHASEKLTVGRLIKRLHSLAFPVFGKLSNNHVTDGFYEFRSGETQGYTSYHHALTYREMVTKIFGVYRKDLVKATLECNIETFQWAENFLDVLGIDGIINVLTEHKESNTNHGIKMDNLESFSDATIQRLMIDGMANEVDLDLLEEALAVASWVPANKRRKCTSWDILRKMGVRYASEGYKGIEVTFPSYWENFFAKYEGSASADETYYVKPLRNSEDFRRVGQEMSNCVSSLNYVRNAHDGVAYCFQVYSTNAPEKGCVALAEVSKDRNGSWKIDQFNGVRNESVTLDVKQAIYAMMKSHVKVACGSLS